MSFSVHLSVCSVVPWYLINCCDFGSASPIHITKRSFASPLCSLPVMNIKTGISAKCLMKVC